MLKFALSNFLRLVFLGACLLPIVAKAAPAAEKVRDGVIISVDGGLLKLQVWTDEIIRVAYAKDRAFFDRPSLTVVPRVQSPTSWQWSGEAERATLSTPKLRVTVDLKTGALSFSDLLGHLILEEKVDGRQMETFELGGQKVAHVRQRWKSSKDEALYGLGQQQLGLTNLKGYDLDLWQHNTAVVVPFFVSTSGYGVFWDNSSFTRWGDLRQFEEIPSDQLRDTKGEVGGLTGTYYTGANFEKLVAERKDAHLEIENNEGKASNARIHPDLPPGPASLRWEGQLDPAESGDYLFQVYSTHNLKLWVDGKILADHWRQSWLPGTDLAKVYLEKGRRVALRLDWSRDPGRDILSLRWKPPLSIPDGGSSLWSEVGEGIDYYFVYGPELDRVIAGYRQITGAAALMPRWAFGLWQSRQRYKTSEEVLDVLQGFRSRNIPVDNIVQDWLYWKPGDWGSHAFDAERFPDPEGWLRAVHDRFHAHLMISVWGKFYPSTANYKELDSKGFIYQGMVRDNVRDWLGAPYAFYDAFNPEARKLYWSQIEDALFHKGVDAWWLDASEPDLVPVPSLSGQHEYMQPTSFGNGARVLNAYALVNSQAVYEGQRAAAPDQRVFILTRSGFAGQQRYAAATWSGDITSTWTALRKQIPAGLGFSISGVPYWTMDIGGFAVPGRFAAKNPKPEDVEEWRELNTRWFEFGTFSPLLRVHGEFPNREMWFFGGESHPAYQAQLKFDRLRYRLLPYIYSIAGGVTRRGGSFMRPLVMDFPADPAVREIADQYLFGPALLVNPVTVYQARTRSLYLPKASGGWYDFWSGASLAGGHSIVAEAPLDAIPLFVKAGSIVPCGPELHYTDEKAADPIAVYVYAGADGEFTFYEDDGVTNGYEKGRFAEIPFRWNDTTKTLVVGARQGTFPGMLEERTFELVLVSKDKPAGFSFIPKADHTFQYHGQSLEVRLN